MPLKKRPLKTKAKKTTKKGVVKTEDPDLYLNPWQGLKKKDVNSHKIVSASKPKSVNLYRKIALSFVFLTIILLAIIFYFSFVHLTIVLIPSQERISNNLIIDIYNKDSEDMPQSKALVGAVENITIAEEKVYSANGSEIIGEEVVGKVTIINNYTKNQPLVATTRLLSPDNKLFRTKKTINVPVGGSVEVEVYADETKPEMAIGPTKFIIPGLWAGLQDKIYAQSQIQFSYAKQTKKYIEQSDIDMAVKDLKNRLLEKAAKEIGDSYKGYDKVIYNIDENTVNLDVDGKVGEEKDEFKIKINASVTIVAFSGEKISNMAQEKLISIVPSDKELIDFNPDEVVYNLNNVNVNQGIATVSAGFEGQMIIQENAEIIDRNKIVGLTREQLEDYLGSFREIDGFEIKFSPSFVDKVPNLVDRIKVEIKK